MKRNGSWVVLACLMVLSGGVVPVTAAEEGVALALVYDTSGSMRESVRDRAGRSTPKYVIANRALTDVANRLEACSKSREAADLKVQAALFIFEGSGAKAVLPLGPFDASELKRWAAGFNNPRGDTPLGNSLAAAAKCVLDSPLSRKHVLVITDGMNTAGPQPSATLPPLLKRAEKEQAALSVHFVAFDIDAKVFDSVKKLGATVVGAANEAQLNSQLDFILRKKILLEEEEEPAPRK